MLTKLKQKVQQALTAEARVARKLGLTPNRISALGIALAILSGAAYAQWQDRPIYLLLATALLLLSGFCDALDGIVARLYQETSLFGGFIDSLLDRYADAAVYVGVIIGGLCDFLWGAIALAGSMLVSYSRARAEAAGIKMESIGLAERAERMIMLAAASLIAVCYEPRITMNTAIVLTAVLSNLTVVQRSLYARRELKKKETG